MQLHRSGDLSLSGEIEPCKYDGKQFNGSNGLGPKRIGLNKEQPTMTNKAIAVSWDPHRSEY